MSVRDDLRLALWAFHGVATSPAMPGWPEYRRRVEASGAREHVGDASLDALRRQMGRRAIVPTARTARAIAALVSFSDDHAAPLPLEMLPRRETLRWIEAVAAHRGSVLSPHEQLARALAIDPDPWTGLLVCHLGTRQLARGRDTRALGDTAPTRIAERLELGRAIAAFPPELACGGDPLGDTYHYWANVIAGVLAPSRGAGEAIVIEQLFRAGPALMSLVREGIFGSALFYGNHARIDALGLEHGLALADAYALGGAHAPRRGLQSPDPHELRVKRRRLHRLTKVLKTVSRYKRWRSRCNRSACWRSLSSSRRFRSWASRRRRPRPRSRSSRSISTTSIDPEGRSHGWRSRRSRRARPAPCACAAGRAGPSARSS
jgi:hypothetical protein